MVSSRNILRRQKTHTKRVYPKKKAVQLPTTQGKPSMYPAQTRGKSRGKQNSDLMEEVLSRQNMLKALRRVEKNKGAPSIDNLTVENLKPYLRQNWLSIREQLLKGDYKPQPVLRVEIDKPNGGKRLLGIPTVIDRLIQQALLQILTDIFDLGFSPFNFGFRSKRKAHDAIRKAKQYIEEGYQWVVYLDIEKFFDRINHDLIMARVARKVKDKRILKLIHLYLNTGVMVKSAVDISDKRKFLGFNLYHYHEGIRICIAPQAIKRFKIKIREITSRSNGQNITKRILRLNLYLRGWMQYFSLSDTPYILQRLEGWIRKRLRMCLKLTGILQVTL